MLKVNKIMFGSTLNYFLNVFNPNRLTHHCMLERRNKIDSFSALCVTGVH